jgi:hypothetical protein
MAPEPRDVLWRSLLRRGRKSRITGTFRQWIVFAAVWYVLSPFSFSFFFKKRKLVFVPNGH